MFSKSFNKNPESDRKNAKSNQIDIFFSKDQIKSNHLMFLKQPNQIKSTKKFATAKSNQIRISAVEKGDLN